MFIKIIKSFFRTEKLYIIIDGSSVTLKSFSENSKTIERDFKSLSHPRILVSDIRLYEEELFMLLREFFTYGFSKSNVSPFCFLQIKNTFLGGFTKIEQDLHARTLIMAGARKAIVINQSLYEYSPKELREYIDFKDKYKTYELAFKMGQLGDIENPQKDK